MSRLQWHDYFMQFARDASSRSSCPRLAVGAVLVKDQRILGTGYNGSPPGLPHCIDIGCKIVDNHCRRIVHAEANALCTAARFGVELAGAELYCTHSPCYECQKLCLSAGIKKIYFEVMYGRILEEIIPCEQLVG